MEKARRPTATSVPSGRKPDGQRQGMVGPESPANPAARPSLLFLLPVLPSWIDGHSERDFFFLQSKNKWIYLLLFDRSCTFYTWDVKKKKKKNGARVLGGSYAKCLIVRVVRFGPSFTFHCGQSLLQRRSASVPSPPLGAACTSY